MPNPIIATNDGSHSLQSEQFGVNYHSIHGAIQESKHVFIHAGLHLKADVQSDIHILEIGFGTGLNAFLSYLETQNKKLNIYYQTLEAFPVQMETIRALNYPQLLQSDQQDAFHQMHSCTWNEVHTLGDNFSFEKKQIDFLDFQSEARFDIIYFDAFAPNAQPELWEIPMLQSMYDALKKDGVLVTYCAKGVFKRNLKGIGFTVEAIPGPPGKREMTRARK